MKPTQRLKQVMALSLVKGMGAKTFQYALTAFGSVEQILGATAAEWKNVQGLSKLDRREIESRKLFEKADAEIEKAQRAGADIFTFFDDAYPSFLKEIYDPPMLIFVKGKLPSSQKMNFAVVGSRDASLYGLKMAERISKELATAGLVIVSGLARGIDAAAHRGALAAKGLTIAVLGGGISRIYPADHKKLAAEVSRNGALVSEYPMDMAPQAAFFPMRNRIISGLSRAVLVAEAREKSGALITADQALEQGREVYALPGPVDTVKSEGSNRLLKQGAHFVMNANDILQDLRVTPGRKSRRISVSEEESKLLDFLEGEAPLHMDDIVAKSRMEPVRAMVLLSGLTLKGAIRELPGKYFTGK